MANALGLGVRSFISNHDIILFLVFVQQYQDHQLLQLLDRLGVDQAGYNSFIWYNEHL
jgi:hypothetical protein